MLALRVNSRVDGGWITYPRNAPMSGPALPTDFPQSRHQPSPLRRPFGADTVAKIENRTIPKDLAKADF
jgi:hypothetical protein